jgi:periplasmic divalent cation tolerance protein
MTVVTVYTVFADHEEAMRIGRTVVEERLAACINLLGPCTSLYWWEGEVTEATEVPAIRVISASTASWRVLKIAATSSADSIAPCQR